MLKVSVHAGPLAAASRFNLVAWVDIGYERLEPVADYKTVLYQAGEGVSMPVLLCNYPRWSASLWDLTARAIALGLTAEGAPPAEQPPAYTPQDKRFAFAQQLCALIEHFSGDGRRRDTLATADITQCGRRRGTYRAVFDEHAQRRHVVESFAFRSAHLRPAELLLHACMTRFMGQSEMPPRPGLCVPPAIDVGGLRYVPIHKLVEPARTGFVRWLHSNSEPPTSHPDAPQGIAPEAMYVTFLRNAI